MNTKEILQGIKNWTTSKLGGKVDKDTDAVTDNLAKFDNDGNPIDSDIAAADVALKEGYYPDLHSGLTDNLFGETQTNDVFTFRPTAGIQDIETGEPPVGGGSISKVEGNSVSWNQVLVNAPVVGANNWNAYGGTLELSDGVLKYTVSVIGDYSYSNNIYSNSIGIVANHKYYISVNIKPAHRKELRVFFITGDNPYSSLGVVTAGIWNKVSCLLTMGNQSFNNETATQFGLNCTAAAGYSVGDVDYVDGVNVIDLTLLGIDSLTTVAEVEQWLADNIGLKDYYPYNAGELIPVKDYKVKSVGFNAWDEQWESGYIGYNKGMEGKPVQNESTIRTKNYIPVIAGQTYYFLYPEALTHYYWLYDANFNCIANARGVNGNVKITIPEHAAFMKFACEPSYGTTYNHDICINLSYDDDKDGTYEEHWEHETAVDVTTLKGKLNGTGSSVAVFPDGLKKAGSVYDEIVRTGGVTKAIKRIGSVDLGTLNWSYVSSGHSRFSASLTSKDYGQTSIAPLVCSKYAKVGTASGVYNGNAEIATSNGSELWIYEPNYSDAATFKTTMSGVMLYYELATPEEYILDDDILPMQYAVDDYGTEELLLGNDSDVVSVAPKMAIKYGINAADTIADLPHDYVSCKPQSLVDSEQRTARNNIGAASQYDMSVVKKQLELIDKKVENDYYVDMGLPSGVLWAKRNIDVTQPDGFAASPFQYECSFFSWGNVDGHNPISTSAFDYDFGTSNGGVYASTSGATIHYPSSAGPSYDIARKTLGAPWRLPSTDDCKELFDNCDFVEADGETVIDASQTNKLVTVNSIIGVYLKSKINGNLLFFPCSGRCNGTSWENRGTHGRYWSLSLHNEDNGWFLYFKSGSIIPQNYDDRFFGFTGRPVM